MQPTKGFAYAPLPSTFTDRSSQEAPGPSRKIFLARRCAPFASLSSSVAVNLGNPGSTPNKREEPNTGASFPLQFCYNKQKDCPSLVGLGVRSKHILVKNVHVYALGIYVDSDSAKSALSGFKSKPASELAEDQRFFDTVVQSEAFEKSLRIVISSRLVDRKKFVDALEERLAPRLKQAGESATLDAFRRQFDDVQFRKDLEISFVATGKGGQLVTQVEGATKGVITSPSLVRSLFDIYLGPDPVSKDAKRTFGESMASLLAA